MCWPFAHAAGPGFAPRSFAYVLQADQLASSRKASVQMLARSDRDLIVLDASFDPNTPWTPAEIERIRRGKVGRRVVAYLSIGEAEDYRSYWEKTWDADEDGRPDALAPEFLGLENPQWKGNYRVRYWLPAWQSLLLPAVDRIVATGFDGIFLDIVDAFESYEFDGRTGDYIDDRTNPETGRSYRRAMIAWVAAIARRAREKHPDFLVIPQNAWQLLDHDDFREIISAIALEDLFINGNKIKAGGPSCRILDSLAKLRGTGKPVLVVEYPESENLRPTALALAARHGFAMLLADRDLRTLGTSQP